MDNRTNAWVAIWVVIALIVGGLIGWFSHDGFKVTTSNSGASTSDVSRSAKAEALNQDMRKLWEEHVAWTRLYIVSAVNNTPDKDQTLARLMQNQVDIGDAIKPYYGDNAGNQLTTLLRQHISLAGDVVTAAVANDTTALNTANTKWYANANDIADFLASANPNLSKSDMRSMMKQHLDLTKQEAVDIIGKNESASVTDYDKIENEILDMSDTISSAIAKQYPDKF